MAFSTGSSHGLSCVKETVLGTTPGSPTMLAVRHKSCSLVLSKDSFQSQELRSDRQISDFRLGAYKVGGDIGIEFSFKEYDSILESALFGTWSTTNYNISLAATTVSVLAAGKTFTRSAGSYLTDGVAVGDIVTWSGFAQSGNNGTFVVSAVTATVMTCATATGLTDEATKANTTYVANQTLTCGTTRKSFSFELRFTDINQYGVFKGVVVNDFALSLKPNNIVEGSFGLVGTAATYSGTTLGVPTASQTYSPYDTFTGTIKEGGSAIAVVTGLDIKLSNNLTPDYVLGSPAAADVTPGRSNLTGTVSAYFSDLTMLNKFINETESSLEFTLGNGTAASYTFTIPRIKYSGSDNGVSSEGPIVLNMPFQSLLDSNTGTNLRIRRTLT